MRKTLFHQRRALRFRQFTRKRWALFACVGRVVTIGVLSVATLQAATAASPAVSTRTEYADDSRETDREATLDDVEVTGSRAPLALGQAARMVTVLTRDEILAAPIHSINDLLKMAVGVDVRQRGPLGAQTDVGIRGGGQEQMAVLLNGINICDPQTGHNTFDLPCDVMDILRIEVLEGPAGRAYGTSSLMGAVNIVTREHDTTATGQEEAHSDISAQVRLEGGSFGYLSGAAHLTHLSPAATQLSASYTRSDGYSRSRSGALNSDYSGGKAFWQGHYDTPDFRLDWHAGMSMRGFGANTFYSARYDTQYEHTTKLYTALQGETKGRLHLRPAIYWNRGYDRFELIRGDDSRVPFNHHRTDVAGISLNGWFDWAAGRTAVGAELRNEDLRSGNLGEPLANADGDYAYGLNRTNISLHVEHNVILRCLTLSAGFIAARNTWSEMPLTLYPGVDASVRMGDHWRIYASYNSSLRMPSFTELYYSVGGHKADKHLKPEEMRAVEGGVKYRSHRVTAQASVFHHHSRNMIDWVMDTRQADAVWQSVNHTRINTVGAEATVSCQLPVVNWQLSYCYLHQHKDEQPWLQSQYSLEYLRHKVTARIEARLTPQLSMSVNARWQDRTGSYTDSGGETREYRPYCVVDSRITWQAERLSLYLAANNITSSHGVDYGNVPQPGCWMTVGTRWRIM